MTNIPLSDDQAETAEELLQAAMRQHQEGDLYAADLLYARVLGQQPQNLQALRLRGILARETGQIDVALRLLEQVQELDPDNAEPLGEIALTLMAAGNLPRAEALMRQALELEPSNVKTLTNLGALLQHRGYASAAIVCYRQALEHEPDALDLRCNLAKALADAGAADEALQECDAAVRSSAEHPHALATRGAVLTDLGQYAAARTALDKACQLNPYDDMALVNLGLCCYELADLDAASAALRQAIDVNPYNARAAADLANCLCAQGGAHDAVDLCHSFLSQHPGERLVVAALALALHNADQSAAATKLVDCDELVHTKILRCPADYESLTEFNQALAEKLRTEPSLLKNPLSKSTSGGSQTGELNLEDGAYTALSDLLHAAVKESLALYQSAGLAEHPLMALASQDWYLRAWGTLLESGGRQTPHMHPLGWISGVYYVSLPADLAAEPDAAGWLEFGQPPERFFTDKSVTTRKYEPLEGKLLMFPSWFWHRTIPFSADEQRISVAFDVMPRAALNMLT